MPAVQQAHKVREQRLIKAAGVEDVCWLQRCLHVPDTSPCHQCASAFPELQQQGQGIGMVPEHLLAA